MDKFLLLLIFLWFPCLTQAQSHAVYGVVHTFDSIPLIGVEVMVKSTGQTTLTDTLGKFSVICKDQDKLKIRAVGFYDENVKIEKSTQLVAVNMKMKPGKKQREYAIGYGYISESDLSAAVANLGDNDTDFSRYNDMYELIRSHFAGVEIKNGEVVIRGSNKLMYGSDAALIVVDDVIRESSVLRTLSPIEVKSINIIKDGTSSVYGTRGSNGVVIIETKKGGDD
ncbi:MAG: carboxypeptidase-like regulatory domain-containing protein [Bacteroidota bacterium]